MNLRPSSSAFGLCLLVSFFSACGTPTDGPGTSTGGSGGTGTTTGGAQTSGGSPGTSGGTPSTSGGAPTTSGGAQTSGGSPGTSGGAPSTSGGTSNGGSSGTAGSSGASGSGSGGKASTGGSAGSTSGGAGGKGGNSATGGTGGGGASGKGGASSGGSGGGSTAKFSFFVTSLEAMVALSKSEKGFGGDFRFGEATGLEGADKICTQVAERGMPGAGAKTWKAFLSTSSVNAIDRIGTGPWYDRLGRLVAQDIQGLIGADRPAGDATIINDLPNENGANNQKGTGTKMDDNHDTVTGTNKSGKWDGGPTCNDWTSKVGGDGPRVGHSWPAGSGKNWMMAHEAPGCAPSVSLVQTGPGSGDGIGNGGGYGGIYCFATTP